jgi:hypothetical protein
LWIIYYDPVFCKIKNVPGLGYTINHSWVKDWALNENKNLQVEIFNIAFMDDTTWVADSKQHISEQLTIADSFNRYNGIKVNPKKLKLIVINNLETTVKSSMIKYGNHDQEIRPLKQTDFTRFLGVWIGSQENKKFVLEQIMSEINRILNLIRFKRITPEQICYIINAVIIPRIEYRSHLSIFNEIEAKKISAKLRQMVRLKMSCSNTLPNVFLSKKEIYHIIDFYQRQAENHITNLLFRLNNTGLLGQTTEIRLRQLQSIEWLHDNPLEIWNYNNENSFRNNLIAQILCIMNRLGISFKNNTSNNNDFRITPGKFPLIDFFKNDYRYFKDSLHKKGFLYIEQILYKGSYSIREWDELRHKFKGPTPKWWNVLRTKLTADGSRLTEKILNEVDVSNIMYNNKPILPYAKVDGRKKQWIVGQLDDSSIIYGQLLTRKQEIKTSSQIKIIHFKKRQSHNNKKLVLEKCSTNNCVHGNNINDNCIITIDKHKCNIIMGNVRKVDGIFTIKQRNSNIERELIITIKHNLCTNNTKHFDNSLISINVSPIVEKEREIFRIGDEGIKTLELV